MLPKYRPRGAYRPIHRGESDESESAADPCDYVVYRSGPRKGKILEFESGDSVIEGGGCLTSVN